MKSSVQLPEIEVEPKLGGHGPDLPPRGHGGGDDNFNNQPQGRRGPHDRLRRFRIGLALGVISIYVIFIALTSAYVIRQGSERSDLSTQTVTRDWVPIALPQILWLNTALLLLSGISVELARRAVFHENAVMEEWLGIDESTKKRSLPWLGITLLLGIGFLAGQLLAWKELVEQGAYAKGNPAAAFFYILTGGHALHLLGGVAGLSFAAAGSWLKLKLETRQIAVDISSWYWHAMGALWVYILALLVIAK